MSAQAPAKPRLIRLKEVTQRTGKSRPAIYVLVKKGEFPIPVKLGPKSIAFIESEIDAWIEQRISDRVTWATQAA